MNSNTNRTGNQKPKTSSQVRPNSSRFPPIVSPEKDFRQRSSSFDYSFTDFKIDLNSNEKSSNDFLQNKTSVEKTLKEEQSKDMIPVLPRASDESQRLKHENQVLKNNFLRMSRIIQKHSRLIAKKDEIILKLQEKTTRNYLPDVPPVTLQNEHVHLLSLSTHLIQTTEIQAKNTEFSLKFRQIYDSMIGDFSQHLTQFMKVIEEMQKFLENNLKVIERRNSFNTENNTDFETKVKTLNEDYTQLKNNYEVLIKQNTEFKSFIELVISSCDSESVKDLSSSESMDSLRQHFTQLLTNNQTLSDEIESIQNSRKTEEDYSFRVIECLTDIELELELLGRNPQTLSKVIEKLDQKLESIRHKFSQTYMESLNKIVLQIYKNHLKWFQYVNKPSKSTQTWIQSRAEDSSTEDEELGSDGKQLICCKMSDSLRSESNVSQKNDISVEIKSKFDELTDETAFDDFDVESINYILMAKYFDYNLKSNLEVVEEVEEEDIEEEESDISYEDNVFEDVEECSEKCLKVTENTDNCVINESNVKYIESVVGQVLNEVLDQITNQFNENSVNKSSKFSDNSLDNKNGIQSSPSAVLCNSCSHPITTTEKEVPSTVLEVKPQYIDSDFVSDDLSSSPETVMAFPDYKNTPSRRGSTISTVFSLDQLKQLNTRQSSELVSAKTRVQELEAIIFSDNNSNSSQTKENQYLNDELKAWKELVEQQKAIMEKIRNELELQQKLNLEKDHTIESLKSQSKSESLADISVNEAIVEQNSQQIVDVSDDECKTLMDELDLNHLFEESDDNEVELIDVNESEDRHKCLVANNEKKSPDILIQEVWTKPNDFLDRNYVSDESSGYSVYTDNSSPLSVPEELLSTNRRKVFIPFSHEDAAVRRHSCQGRLIHYGNHPRKKKLELKNVEIVFQQQKESHRVKLGNKK